MYKRQVDKIQVADGVMHFGTDDDVKAMAGDDAWSDYVVKADITLTQENDQNAGCLLYTSVPKDYILAPRFDADA